MEKESMQYTLRHFTCLSLESEGCLVQFHCLTNNVSTNLSFGEWEGQVEYSTGENEGEKMPNEKKERRHQHCW